MRRSLFGSRRIVTGVLSAVLAATPLSLSEAQAPATGAWPQWRGPSRTGQIEPTTWPDSLDESHLSEVWRVELGPSYSGPIVADGKVFVTETVDKQDERVTAYSVADGSKLWSVSWPGAMSVPFFAKANGDWIRATPAYADGRLYVAGMRDVLVCLDANDGHELWRFDFPERLGTPLPDFGFVCSPMIDGEHLLVQAGGGFVKIDRATGELVWRVLDDGGGMMGSAFSSPVRAKIRGVDQYVVQTREKLCGVAVDDGRLLWEQTVPAFRGMNILTPTVLGDRIFTSAYGGESFCYELANDGEWKVSTVWSGKWQGYMSSPVVVGEHLYLHQRNQRLVCLGVADGAEAWTTKPFGKYWSLVANGNRLLALDETGKLLLIDADPAEFRLVSTREVATSETWAHLAVVGDLLFVRSLDGLIVFRWK